MYTKKRVRSDKFKTGVDQFVSNEFEMEDNRDLIIGRMPVMVNSDLCWMSDGNKKPDCEFDHGGYFIVKGAEKVLDIHFALLFLSFISFSYMPINIEAL